MIEYKYSEAPTDGIKVLRESLLSLIEGSTQWKWERDLGGSTTDCLNILVPKDRSEDISITIRAGFEEGMKLVQCLRMKTS